MYPTHTTRHRGAAKACLLAAALLAGATPSRAQTPNRYTEDAKRVEAIIKWTSGTWSFINGARTAVGFLTGFDGQTPVTLKDIHETVVDALRDEQLKEIRARIDGWMDRYHQTQVMVRDQVQSGQPMDSLMTSPWGTTHLRDRLTALIDDGTDLLNLLEPHMRAPANRDNDRRLVDALPAYTVLVPALLSAMKLAVEIDPLRLKRSYDQIVSEKLMKAQQILFTAAGAYLLYAWDPTQGPGFFYSPVGDSRQAWMLNRPLYRYHYLDPYKSDPGGLGNFQPGNISGPIPPFSEYQALPDVKLALDSLERAASSQHAMVVARDIYVYNLRTTADRPGNYVAKYAFGYILRVRN